MTDLLARTGRTILASLRRRRLRDVGVGERDVRAPVSAATARFNLTVMRLVRLGFL
jgi:hypothetical protein